MRSQFWRLLAVIAFATTGFTVSGSASATTPQETLQLQANAIKRYLFSVDTFDAVRAEFQNMKLVIAAPMEAPAAGQAMRVEGTGASGISSHYVVENVGDRFHVYNERRRPQHPVGPLPYVAQDVVFDTPNPQVSPVGTLTYPKGGGSFPGVVLIAGTGAHTRDAGMSLHKTLLVLADHLTRQGFAVLRYDKRGVGLTGGEAHPGSTTDDYAADVLAAVRFMKLQTNVAPSKIGLVGHSEGGIIAAMVAAEAPSEIKFVVMLGGTGLPGIDLKSLQDSASRRADGMPDPLIAANWKQERELYEIAASNRNHNDALAAMQAATHALSAEVKTLLEIPAQGIPNEAFEALLTPWFRRFLNLDPRIYLEKVSCPVLALIGEKDVQVPPKENLLEIEKALKRGNNRQSRVLELPLLNHNFQTAKTGRGHEYFLIEETIAPSALQLISGWMQHVAQ